MRCSNIFILFYVVMFAGLRVGCAEVAGLGESLFLEGRMALLRGEAWVLSCQNPDGSWQNSPGLTAQAGLLLANSNSDYYKEQLQRAIRWILDHEKQLNCAGEFAQALRLPLRMNHPKLVKLVKDFQEQNIQWNMLDESVFSRQWLLDAHYLLPQELTLLSASKVQQLQQSILQAKERYPALALLTLLSSGSSQIQTSELEKLHAVCVAQVASAEPEYLFWIVRALRVSERFFPMIAKPWRAAIVSQVLEKQGGQGAFAGADSAADLSTSVLYLQILQLCLAP